MNFAISYSGGKDSALALCRMIEQGHTPACMITTVNIAQKRSWFHGIQNELLDAVSQSLGIPLILCECTPDNYTQTVEQSLEEARAIGAEACVFGDIDIDDHRAWNEERCRNVGLKCILPLWKEEREALVAEQLERGFKAIIKIVDGSKLDVSFLGKTLSVPLIEKMKSLGVDPCGESGEYHTFVVDGPIFQYPILYDLGEIIDLGTHQAVDILSR